MHVGDLLYPSLDPLCSILYDLKVSQTCNTWFGSSKLALLLKDPYCFHLAWCSRRIYQLAGDQMQHMGCYFPANDAPILARPSGKFEPRMRQRRKPDGYKSSADMSSSIGIEGCFCHRTTQQFFTISSSSATMALFIDASAPSLAIRSISIAKLWYERCALNMFLRPTLLAAQVYRCNFWMAFFNSKSPKRTSLWSNSRYIRKFWLGKLTKEKKAELNRKNSGFKTVIKYTDKQGKKRFHGSKQLRSTQKPGW